MTLLQRALNSFLHGPIYIILFGLVFFAIGAGLSYHQYALAQTGIQVQGEVVSLTPVCDDEGCTYAPVVRFKAQDGRTITIESNQSSSPPAYDIGETVLVLYPPEKPEKAVIKGEGLVFRIIFTSVGGIIMLAGVVLFYKLLKDNSSTS